MSLTFRNPIRYGLKKELFIAPEGLYSGQVRSLACTAVWINFSKLLTGV